MWLVTSGPCLLVMNGVASHHNLSHLHQSINADSLSNAVKASATRPYKSTLHHKRSRKRLFRGPGSASPQSLSVRAINRRPSGGGSGRVWRCVRMRAVFTPRVFEDR